MQRFISSFSVFLLFFVVINSLFYPVMADVLRLKSEHPDYYVVKKGDTLWDISAYFVNDPWHWPELWGDNTHIANPHLIYPGDKLTLSVVDGKPRLVVKPYFKKHPQGRIVPKNDAIPTVDLSLIRPYLIHNKIVDADWLAKQPIVLGGESASRHHVTDNIIYIKGPLSVGGKIGLYEEGRLFKRQQNGELLGQEAILTATGRVMESGDISKVKIINSYRETKAGYRVLSIDNDLLFDAYFVPKPADIMLPAKILSSAISIREMGKLDLAYIDRGISDGVRNGDVFAMYRDGDEVLMDLDGKPILSNNDTSYNQLVSDTKNKHTVKHQLPDIYHGNIMVFKTFLHMSIGIIMANELPVRVNDNLVIPKVEQL